MANQVDTPEKNKGGRPRKAGPKRQRPRGRPKSQLSHDALELIGSPPKDPLAKSAWWATVIEVLTAGVLRGEPWRELLDMARQSAAVATKLIPEAIRYNALELLREDKEDRVSADAPDDEPIEKVSSAARSTSLRRDPSRS